MWPKCGAEARLIVARGTGPESRRDLLSLSTLEGGRLPLSKLPIQAHGSHRLVVVGVGHITRATLPNNPINPSVVPVTRLACARRAPVPPAGYRER